MKKKLMLNLLERKNSYSVGGVNLTKLRKILANLKS